MERVWRFIEGKSSDEDKKKVTPSKKTSSVKAEKHRCFATNSKGVPCGTAGSEEYCGNWFCWRHISEADKLIATGTKEIVDLSADESTEENEQEDDEIPEEIKNKKVKKAVKVFEKKAKAVKKGNSKQLEESD
jgi:hypothetical protein